MIELSLSPLFFASLGHATEHGCSFNVLMATMLAMVKGRIEVLRLLEGSVQSP